MALTDITIRNAKPKDKPYKLGDSLGLNLIINTSGSKYWYQKYRFDGKEKKIAFGGYPAISFADARGLRDNAKVLLSQGIDPSQKKRHEKQIRRIGKRLNRSLEHGGTAIIAVNSGHPAMVTRY